ncbi:MAG: S8 family serine peptidase [Pseudothermotoga sp.]
MPQDENGHGTHVTGIISAVTNNDKGIASVTWGLTKILPLRVFDASGIGTYFNVTKAFLFAVDHGAKIINFSGGGGPSDVVYEVVKYAYDNDVIIVCAAGNDGSAGIDYPAAYRETIAVGAVNSSLEKASYSDYGPELDFVAPGGEPDYGILSTWLNNSYQSTAGTSMATPHVTGVIALMIAKGITGVENIRYILGRTAFDSGSTGRDEYYGWGLIDAYRALTWLDDWEPLIVYSLTESNILDQWTVADSRGNYQLDVSSQKVYIYAWMDFDHDDLHSPGDLFGYYGYTSGNPLDGQPSLITLSSGQIRQLDFNIAPIIDTTNRPELSTYDQERLKAFKENVINNYYEELRKR